MGKIREICVEGYPTHDFTATDTAANSQFIVAVLDPSMLENALGVPLAVLHNNSISAIEAAVDLPNIAARGNHLVFFNMSTAALQEAVPLPWYNWEFMTQPFNDYFDPQAWPQYSLRLVNSTSHYDNVTDSYFTILIVSMPSTSAHIEATQAFQ